MAIIDIIQVVSDLLLLIGCQKIGFVIKDKFEKIISDLKVSAKKEEVQ